MKYLVGLLGCALHLAAAEPMHVYTLDGPWRAHAGDDPRWAAPDFEDSAWPEREPPLAEPGFAWYRRTLRLPADLSSPAALWFPSLARQAEIYVNGRLALRHGTPGQWFTQRWGPPPVLSLANAAPGSTLVLALRVYESKNSVWDVCTPPLLGSPAALADGYDRNRFRLYRVNLAWLLLGLLNLLFASAAFVFWRMQPGQPVYLWFAVALVLGAVWNIPQFANNCSDLLAAWTLPGDSVAGAEFVAWVFLFHGTPAWPGLRNLRLAALTVTLTTAMTVAAYAGVLQWSSYYAVSLLATLVTMVLAARGVQTTPRDERRALVVLLIPYLVYALGWVAWHARSLKAALGGALTESRGLLVLREPFEVDLSQAGALLSILVMGGILLARFNRVARDQQALSGELEAARRVQEFLVPAAGVEVPGFEVGSAYLPAQRVGGDFFQLAPLAGGGLVVLVGDVSGKGLRAAMVVSLVVGAFRNRRSHQPAEILEELNAVLAGQMGGGFVTCCCACFYTDGTVTIANAGHPSPYCDGRELTMEPGLPLGVVPGIEYQQTVVHGKQFTFVSDGVVEAENDQRELFGFDRTRDISMKPAAEIADAAKAWGQTDDITVVTVRSKA